MSLADGLAWERENPMEDFGPVTVGDLNSDARGSGARRSAGKPDWSQLPFWTALPALNFYRSHRALWDAQGNMEPSARAMSIIGLMADWQRGGPRSLLDEALAETLYLTQQQLGWDNAGTPPTPLRALLAAVRVLEFGARKYKKANWAKGMPWSTAFTCTMSHLLKFLDGAEDDEESNQHTLAHAAVNLMFLIAYYSLYPEGDDRFKEFAAPKQANWMDLRSLMAEPPPADQVHP